MIMINESDEYDPFDGKVYRVQGTSYTSSGELGGMSNVFTTNDPKKAIEKWFELGKKYPTGASLMAKHRPDAINLIKAASNTSWLTSIYKKYGSPYKLDYMISAIEDSTKNGCRYFYDSKYGYGDEVHPFSHG